MRRIPVYSPGLAAEDVEAVSAATAEGFISSAAPPVGLFEREWAERCGMPWAVAVSSGTAALELLVPALDIGPGDEVICPALTIISCARAIVQSGARPVLVDVDPGTWCLDVRETEARLSPRTRAVLGVHLFGLPYDHASLAKVSREHSLLVIEDAAQAHGARVRVGDTTVPCGALGDASIFSFYANKAVTTGEGGMVLTRDEAVAGRVRDSANLYLGGPRRFLHEDLGFNYRMSSLQAALGRSQARRLDRTLEKKRLIGLWYRERLGGLRGVELQAAGGHDDFAPWMNALVLSDDVPCEASEVMGQLQRRGIETRPFFIGLHEQPALTKRGWFGGERYPVTERLSRRGFYLPSGLDLDEGTVDHVVGELRAVLAGVSSASVAVPPEPVAKVHGGDAMAVFGPAYAEAYDAFYEGKDYAAEVDVLVSCFDRHSSSPVRRILDLGCGTGRHVGELASRGYEVLGVDRSASMLALARLRCPGVRFVEADMRTVDLGETVDAVVILFAALGYLTTAEDILAALRATRRHLEAGGLLVADVWLGGSDGQVAPTRRTAQRGAVTWTRTGFLSRDPVLQRVDLAYELVRAEGGARSVVHEVHRMHYFSPFELDFALRAAGFRLVRLCRDGDLDHAPRPRDLTALFVAEAV